jgi:protein-S-isoprenylcysteine O-methyltransferase Ste14
VKSQTTRLDKKMVSEKTRKVDTYVIATARFTGSVSLLLFALFLFFGSWPVIDMQLSRGNAMLWNAVLSLLFFIQHSGMVRQELSARLAAFLPAHYHRAFYTLVSSVVLTAVVMLWQPAREPLLELQGTLRWVARGAFLLGLAGFAWGVGALKSFDAFGETDIEAHWKGRPAEPHTFAISGPYRWVRHPLYFFALLLIWSCPDLTTDRLFFNVLWTAWIYVGTFLEERDLVTEFGDTYRRYQRRVPMLIPWKGPTGVQNP